MSWCTDAEYNGATAHPGPATSRFGFGEDEIESEVSRTIDGALCMLGEGGKQALLFHICERFNFNVDEIPHDPEKFGLALAALLGSGAEVIELMMVQQALSSRDNRGEEREYVEKMASATQAELSVRSAQGGWLGNVGLH